MVQECPNPPHKNCIGTLFGRPVYHWNGPFSSSASKNHNWILVPDKGVRKVQMDEMEKMKGLQNSKYSNITYQIISTSIEQHVYATINMAIAPTIIAPGRSPLQLLEKCIIARHHHLRLQLNLYQNGFGMYQTSRSMAIFTRIELSL